MTPQQLAADLGVDPADPIVLGALTVLSDNINNRPPPAPKPEDRGRHSDHPCEKCGKLEVWVQEINDYPDYRITCYGCNYSYCVDGPDS